MSWTKPDDSLREQSPEGRFEIMCEKFIDGGELVRKTILSVLSPEEQHTFLCGVGLYRMFRDQRYYKAVQHAIGEQIYREAHPEMKWSDEE